MTRRIPNPQVSFPLHIAVLTLFCLLLIFACQRKEKILFVQKTPQQTGIDFQNQLSPSPELNILNYIYYYNGGGVASGDFNNDGLQDLYFTANQAADKLYINKGDFRFEDVTIQSGIENAENWTTGVTTVDINQDGLLDIYVCKVGNYQSIKGRNLLYINQGISQKGVPRFTEQAEIYGLDFEGFATQASFFDYDLDGDLDMFLLNHSVNPNQNYGKGSIRDIPDKASGDKLFENTDGLFIDVSEAAGIIESKIGYGLGVGISDLNLDGFPDLYIGNDFFENDYLYLSNGDKTFEEIIQKKNNAIGHTTHFSMGNDIGDINNDGLPDIVSLDMLPEDLITYKSSGTEFNYQIYQNYISNGYAHQFMQNTLQLNNGGARFSEIAHYSGIAATEWSWSPLIADYNNNGRNDLFISNGIPGATNDMDFINFIANEAIQKSLGEGMSDKEMALIDKIPEKKTANYFFENNGNLKFIDVSEKWAIPTPSFSNGAVYTDLDNDGDLDLVVNNINETATILENSLELFDNPDNFFQVKLNGKPGNIRGIGATVKVFSDSLLLVKENFVTRGYLSAVSPKLHFGIGSRLAADSIHIIWPDRTYEVVYKTEANKLYEFTQNNASGNYEEAFPKKENYFLKNSTPLFEFVHQENTTLEFNRDPLIPFACSNEGPGISVADINNDGLDDLSLSGGKGQATLLWVQRKDGSFESVQTDLFEANAISEDIDQLFFDANGDGFEDLIVISGGNEFTQGPALHPRLYLNQNGTFTLQTEQFNTAVNASSVAAVDIDNDDDLDISITSAYVPHRFGESPAQHIFLNENGTFRDATSEIAPQLTDGLGNITTQQWLDIDGNNYPDLILAGEWCPIKIFLNDGNRLQLAENTGLDKTNGLWNVLKAADFDNDGDVDLVAGNWGLNSRLSASIDQPVRLYRVDADDNGKEESLITYFYKGEETTLASKDELTKQLPGINKNYLSYESFARASLEDIFTKEKLTSAMMKEVYELGSCFFENDGTGRYTKQRLPDRSQFSSVNDIAVIDFNKDGFLDLLLVGNNFEISTQLSRLDALHGVLLTNNREGGFSVGNSEEFNTSGACRAIENFNYQGEEYLIVTRNNNHPIFLKMYK